MRISILRIIFTFLVLIILSACGSQSIKEIDDQLRQIGYVEQEQPGALIVLTLTDTAKVIGGSILDVKAGMRDNRFSVTQEQFAYIWSSLSSPEFTAYQFTPNKTDSMSDPKYYTISKKSVTGDLNYRIPIDTELQKIENVINALKAIILENS